MTRRTTMLATAGAVAASALVAGVITMPSAMAGSGTGASPDGDRQAAEAQGVRIAADRAAAQGVDWKDCPADWGLKAPVQCGWVTVPVDYTEPDGPTIELAVDRSRSTGSEDERQGSLLYNPGGPGGSGLRFPLRATGDPVWAKAAKAYDFVGFDPRGVGRSAPISCMDPQEFVKAPKMDPVPADEADKSVQRTLAREYAEGCQERGGDLLPHMTTPNTARDLDVIRAALGERQLNYLGVSYGTYLGAVYAQLFPGNVRRMIFDSVVNPSREKVWYEANLDQNVAFEMRWNDWKAWVADNDAAYGLGATAEDVQSVWEDLRAAAGSEPLGGVVGPAELLGYFQDAAYSDHAWAPVAATLSAYAKGDEQPLVKAAGQKLENARKAENSNAVYTAVECNDAEWPTDWQRWDADSTRLHTDHPFMTWSNTWMNLPCSTWPLRQNQPVDVNPGSELPPTLIVQAERDAATPMEGALELNKRLPGSQLVTELDSGSHGVAGETNPCINERVDAYLLEGTVESGNATCEAHAAPKPQ